ncbi:MAG TPA: 50S ribosomal protein L30 [Acidimicrobiia bacterium]|jgi:large subunit ribosomal protein L30
MAEKMIRITLRRSLIGEKPKNRATVQSLGLRRVGQTVERPDDPSTQGMIRQVAHLLRTEPADPE